MTFEEFIREWQSPASEIEAHTSGSTGDPKTIRLDKEFVRASALRTNSFFGINSTSRLHSCVAPDFIGGKMMAVRAVEAGCRLTWEKPSNRPLEALGKEETVDLLAVVPSQMIHILDNLPVMPEIRAVIIGGSAIDPHLRRKIVASGLNAYETYGMTETASHIALRKIADGVEGFSLLPGISVALDNRGCLEIMFDSGERVVTNDLATLLSPTEFRIDGRHDHMILTGGRKVNPFKVEEKLAGLIRFPFVITSEPDEKWGSRVVLKIEAPEGMSGLEDLTEKMKRLLDPWEVPKRTILVERLDYTKNGKLKR